MRCGLMFTEFTETTTVQDSDCRPISKYRLIPIYPTFYNVTLINNDNWIPAPTAEKMLLKRVNGAAINTVWTGGGNECR